MVKENRIHKFENAFIVKDAKTYINAEEAWFQFSGKKEGAVLFIVIPKKDPNNTLGLFDEVIDNKKWGKIIWFKSYSNYAPIKLKRKIKRSWLLERLWNAREFVCNFIDRIRLNRLAKNYAPIDTIFSGHKNTQEHLAHVLEPSKLYIMDSGTGIQKRIRSGGYIEYRPYSRRHPIKYILHKLSGLKVFDRKKTKIFTVYSNSVKTKHKIVKNDYSYHKMLLKSKKIGDKVFFVSSPIFNRENISVQQHIIFIKEIFNELNLNPSNVVYIPHPTYENETDIQLIVNSLGCEVDSRDIPFETKITLYDNLPKMCVTPYSSSIFNIASFTEDRFSLVYAWHPEFDCFKHIVRLKNSVLKKTNVELIELKNVSSLFRFKGEKCTKPRYKDFEEWDAAVESNLISVD